MLHIFTDASVHPQTRKGMGAFIIAQDLGNIPSIDYVELSEVTSTLAEYYTILHVLRKIFEQYYEVLEEFNPPITLYTDCENFVRLVTMRINNVNIRQHRYFTIYQEIFDLVDLLNVTPVWTKGHSKKERKLCIWEPIFATVDAAARAKLREIRKI